jgi:hypothetical protein
MGAVLEAGVVRLVRAAGELLADPDVARLYLGGTPQPPGEARMRAGDANQPVFRR